MAEQERVTPTHDTDCDDSSNATQTATELGSVGNQLPASSTEIVGPRSRVTKFFRGGSLALILIFLIIIVWFRHNELLVPSVVRACIVFTLASGLLFGAHKTFFSQRQDSNDPLEVRFVIAFDSVVFVIVGLVAAILSCGEWEAAALLAGSCLLIGGFFGLLFGYPQGVAQQSTQAQQGQPNPQTPSRDKNLLAESAATLGKVITGFTLAKVGQVSTHYAGLCQTIGPVLGAPESATSHVLAGVIIAYFLATGFLSGLLLPPYFMSDRF
jgi:hypothetical protein